MKAIWVVGVWLLGGPVRAFGLPERGQRPFFFTVGTTADTLRHDSVSSVVNKPLTRVSIGGNVRTQYFLVKNENWGSSPDEKGGYVLSRTLAHVTYRPAKSIVLFGELQSSLAWNKTSPTPVDKNELDLHQLFVQYSWNTHQRDSLFFKFGRQELSYGLERLISVRDGPNNRRAFDGALFRWKQRRFMIDAFLSEYVSPQTGYFNDRNTKNTLFWGTYGTLPIFEKTSNLDLYYLGQKRESSAYEDAKGQEIRHTFGARWWKRSGQWQFDGEVAYQSGKAAEKEVSAYTATILLSYAFDMLCRPTLGLKTEVISGDRRKGDNQLQTFNPLYPRGGYFGLAALIGPENLFDVHPSITGQCGKRMMVEVDADFFHRYSKADGLYSPAGSLMVPSKNSRSLNIGHQYACYLTWEKKSDLYIRFEFTYFQAMQFLLQTTQGKNILFFGFTFQKWVGL